MSRRFPAAVRTPRYAIYMAGEPGPIVESGDLGHATRRFESICAQYPTARITLSDERNHTAIALQQGSEEL